MEIKRRARTTAAFGRPGPRAISGCSRKWRPSAGLGGAHGAAPVPPKTLLHNKDSAHSSTSPLLRDRTNTAMAAAHTFTTEQLTPELIAEWRQEPGLGVSHLDYVLAVVVQGRY